MSTTDRGEADPFQALGSSEARLARVLEAMPSALLLFDTEWRFTYANAEAERLLGYPRDAMLGQTLFDLFPEAAAGPFETHYRAAVETGEPVVFEAYYPQPLDNWYEVRAWPSGDGLAVYFLDISARRSAQERADHRTVRARLLTSASEQLSSTLDAQEAAVRLAQLLVPAVADWCLVSLVDDDASPDSRGLRDVASWHADPSLRPVADAYRVLRMPALAVDSYLDQAVASTSPVVVPAGSTGLIAAKLAPGEAKDLFTMLAPESAVFLALAGRGRLVGGLSLFRGAARGAMSGDDLALADEVAVRAGLALDNARLFRQQQQLAEAFQRSLLTPPPEPDHMQVVVRYAPAAEAAQVGGDWYDAFLQRDGATVLVIGDVIGHDTAAAAAMGQMRSLLRGIAARTGEGPADVLRGVDEVMETLQVHTTATVVVARVEQNPDERERGITHLRWSNAGHPPPMAVNPDGSVVLLAGVGADLLLGIDPGTERVESSISLDRGSTVLLYTDGLVERRGQSLDEGLARLRDVLLELAHLELDELCDAVIGRMLPPRPEDDVALVAVRLHRQDRPRPPEAGPEIVPDVVPRDD